MATHQDLVTVCDRCTHQEILKSKPLPEERYENDQVRNRLSSWNRLRATDMGGDTEWDLCPECWILFISDFIKGGK